MIKNIFYAFLLLFHSILATLCKVGYFRGRSWIITAPVINQPLQPEVRSYLVRRLHATKWFWRIFKSNIAEFLTVQNSLMLIKWVDTNVNLIWPLPKVMLEKYYCTSLPDDIVFFKTVTFSILRSLKIICVLRVC